jgi:hypothetical protein
MIFSRERFSITTKCYVHKPGYSGAIRFEVLSRTLSPGNDTLCYMLRHFDYVGYYNGSMQYTFNNYNKQVCYTNLDSMVHTLIDTTGMITTPMDSFRTNIH